MPSFANKPASTTSAASRVKKPIDLGAAAAFAAKPPAQQQQQKAAADPYQNYNPIVADLFAADDDVTPAPAAPKAVSSNLSFDADDFDPRDSANANGAFGDFSAAFSPPKSSDNQPTKAALDDGDDFADFSSAFGGGSSNPAPAAIPAAVFSPAPVASSAAPMFDLFSDAPSTEKVSTVDLLSGLDMGGGSFIGQMSAAPAPSNLGGLSGLNFSPPPPLIGANSMGLTGGAPLQPKSSNAGSFFDFDSQGPMGGPQLQPHNSNNNVINSTTSMSTSNSSNFSKKPTTWDTVAGVNIDLDNLKLGGKSQKKPALPMNALMTPTSSPTKGFANQPPSMMKPGTISSNNLL